MKIDLVKLLKACKIFSSLDENVLHELLTKFKKVHLDQGNILFNQGELSNYLYLIVSGKIAVFLNTNTNETLLINEYLPGMLIGELSALSHEPRGVTAKAIRKCTLLRMTSEDFIELCKKYNSITLELINSTLSQSRNIIRKVYDNQPIKKHIAILPANEKVNFELFCESILQFNPYQNLIILDDEKVKEQFSSSSELQTYIDDTGKENKIFLFLIKKSHSMLMDICFKHERVDMIYIVGNQALRPVIKPDIFSKMEANKYKIIPDLIIFHENGDEFPKYTSKWLKKFQFNLHHHIRADNHEDWHRLLRFMTGNAIGIVLGGGGLRCWAQLGALRALNKYHIPVDAIGGTSAGAIVAGYYAMKQSLENPLDLRELSDLTREAVALKNLTWPTASLFNGKNYTLKLQKIFKQLRVENLWIPCFCVTTNLADNKQVISRKGYLWRVIRASTAVPLVFPPVVVKGHLYLDGGLLNNLPVDIMKKIVSPTGKVIAIELTHKSEDPIKYNFPPILPFWKTVLTKLGFYKKEVLPNLIDTFLKALLAGASSKQNENGAMADMLISPDLSKFRLINVTKAQEDELIKIGYDAATKQIKKSEIVDYQDEFDSD